MVKKHKFLVFSVYLLVIAVALPATAIKAQTDDFQFEVGAMFEQSKDEDDFKTQFYGPAASYYFIPVSLTTLPWAETAFLAKASNVSLYASRATLEYDEQNADGSGYLISLSGEFYVPNIPLYLSAEVSRLSLDADFGGIDVEITNTDLIGKAGFLPMNGLLFGALLGHSTQKLEVPDFPALDEEETAITYGGFLKTVMPVGSGMAVGADFEAVRISVEPEEGDKSANTKISCEAAFYPIAQLGIGVILEIQSGDDKGGEGNTYGAQINFFPIKKVEIGASFARFIPKDDEEGAEEDKINIGVIVRI